MATDEIKWIKSAIKHPGALRRTAGVKKGQKIPLSVIRRLKKSKNPTTRRRAALALTLRRLRKKGA